MSEESPTIRELDERTVEQIAAGEVVERPASAVKELVENSLDADASRIAVAVSDGGIEGIEVIDDGVGMDRAGLRKAVLKHTTSKIQGVEDLEAGVSTLGFRGEALSAIGAVSHLTISSRPRDGDEASEIRVEGGEVVEVAPTGRGPGTTVTVKNLFFNVPARQEFLESERTEFRHVNRVVTRYALANPDVAISLSHNGRETFATAGDGDRRAAVMAVYGREVAESMIAVDADPDGPLERVTGLISDPETTRSSRAYISTYVNGRYVESGTLREAIVEAYGSQLAADRFPFAAVFVSCPPGTIDPNVHPRKLSVRFENEQAVQSTVQTAVRDALLAADLIRSGAPRGQSAPDTTTPRPAKTDTAQLGVDAHDHSAAGGETEEGNTDREATQVSSPSIPDQDERTDTSERRASPEGSDRYHGVNGRFQAPTRDVTLEATEDEERSLELDSLPPLTILGQFRETYLIAESPRGLVLIDQHAADERVHFERFREKTRADSASQSLLVPVEVALTAAEAETLRAALPTLRSLGFEASLTDEDTATVTAVPTVLGEALEPDLLQDVLAEAVGNPPAETVEGASAAVAETVEGASAAVLADVACHPAVTAQTSLTSGSIVELLEGLDACENPYTCPHGRPTIVAIDDEEINARFERDYPGHTTREPESDELS